MYRIVLTGLLVCACGASTPQPATQTSGAAGSSEEAASTAPQGRDDFGLREGDASGPRPSSLQATATEAVLKLLVRDPKGTPIPKVVVKISGPGVTLYTPETDGDGYTEVLVPIGNTYTLTYLSLFEDPIEKTTTIPNEPNISVKLTLTYTPPEPPPPPADIDPGILVNPPSPQEPRLILEGVVFDTGKATLKPESFPHLAKVVEFMRHKPSAIIEVSGHTDNVGNPKKNQKLSEERAMAVRDYLISQGIEGDRIIAVGYGDTRPIASNDTPEGRQLNRRTEARELTAP